MEVPAEEVALLYKKRWGIELLFKKLFLQVWAITCCLKKNSNFTG